MTSGVLEALAAGYAHGPGKSVRVTDHTPRAAHPRPAVEFPFATLDRLGGFGRALRATLVAALAPQRWEPWNPHNDHRAYPSPRAVHLTDVVLRLGTQRWTVDPIRHTLGTSDAYGRPPADLSDRTLPAAARAGSATLELHTTPDRLPAGYGGFRQATALLEAGHVGAALAEAAHASGLVVETASLVSDDWPKRDMRGRIADVNLRALSPGTPQTTASPASARATANRSAGLGPTGIGADPRPLPVPLLRALLEDSTRTPPGSPVALADAYRFAVPSRRALGHRLVVRNVAGLADGLYEADAGALTRLGSAPSGRRLQAAFRHGPDEVDIESMNVVWLVTADIAAGVRAAGPRAYPDTLMSVGATAQHVCTAAARSGLFCRPVRSFAEPATEALFGAPAGEDALYMMLIGRPRVLDFCYDLTDPEATS